MHIWRTERVWLLATGKTLATLLNPKWRVENFCTEEASKESKRRDRVFS